MMLLLAILIGVVTGLIPGLHVNLLAAIALTIPGMERWSTALIVIGVVHTFVTILPTTYIGAPDADGAMTVLPAHRLLLQGEGPSAVRLSLQASMAAALATCLLLIPYHWLLTRPGVPSALASATPALLVIPAWLAWRARSLWAVAIAAMAAGLGWIAFDWPIHSILPGSPLLPLLSGLFGVPTLLAAGRHIPWQAPAADAPLDARATGAGVLASAFTAVMPGVTAAVASALAVRGDARRVLATMSAVNTAHLIFAMGVLWILGSTRSGLAIAWNTWETPAPWLDLPPMQLVHVLAWILIAGAGAVVGTMVLDGPYRRLLRWSPPGVAERCALVCIIVLTALTTGWTGMLLLVAASVLGMLPVRLGLARIHLAACLSVPIALRSFPGLG